MFRWMTPHPLLVNRLTVALQPGDRGISLSTLLFSGENCWEDLLSEHRAATCLPVVTPEVSVYREYTGEPTSERKSAHPSGSFDNKPPKTHNSNPIIE